MPARRALLQLQNVSPPFLPFVLQIAVNREKQYIESAPTATTETASARMAGRGSSYPTAAGSNYLAAERDASNRDVSDDQLWGTGGHHHNIDLNNPEQQRQQREWK